MVKKSVEKGGAAKGGGDGKAAKAAGGEKAAVDGKKGAGKKGKEGKEVEAKQNKKDAALAKASVEAERRAAADEMLLGPTDDDDYEEEEEVLCDKFGNSISRKEKADADRRESLRAARQAKQQQPEAAVVESDGGWLADYAKVKAKALEGGKLSNKDKKLIKRGEARDAEDAELKKQGVLLGGVVEEQEEDNGGAYDDTRLEGFTLSVPGGQIDEDSTVKDVVLKGVTLSAPGNKPLLVNAELCLTQGRRYGLIGANGRGKSSLLRMLASRRLPLPKSMEVLLVEQEAAASARPVIEEVLAADRTRTALLKEEKDLCEQLEYEEDLKKVLDRLGEVVEELEARDADSAESKARSILSGLGFTESMIDGGSGTLSGGWRMRVALARALFVEPALLLLDEPTNHLDLEAAIWLEEHLKRPSATSTLLVVSHDRGFLDETCTDLMLLTEDGDIETHRGGLARLEAGNAARLAKRRRDFALTAKTIKEEKAKHPSLNVEKLHRRCLEKLSLDRLILDKPREYVIHFDFKSPEEGDTNVGAVALHDVSFSYGGGQQEAAKTKSNSGSLSSAAAAAGGFANGFSKLNFVVDGSTRACLVGANGSGKSTLLKLLAGVLEPTAGEIARGRLRVAYYDQHFGQLSGFLQDKKKTGLDLLLARHPADLKASPQQARRWMAIFGLDSGRHVTPVAELSGGEKARLCFALIALSRPHLIVLDEPTNHLDLESIEALIRGLQAFQGGVLAVSHDACLVEALSRDRDGVETPLFVCGEGAVTMERGGFAAYRDRLHALAEKRAAAIAKVAEARNEKRKRDRRDQLERAKRRVAGSS